jgi:Transposase IS200 like
VEEVIGYLKEKSSTWIAQNVKREARNFLGHKFWARGARGYFVSTIGQNKEMTCAYIKNPEMADNLQLKPASPQSPISCPRVLHNRLWRFPFKPPALLGVIDSGVSAVRRSIDLRGYLTWGNRSQRALNVLQTRRHH